MKYFISTAILIITVIISITFHTTTAFGTISVWTERPVYYVGEPVRISFDTMGGGVPATVTIEIYGPVSLTWGPTNLVTGMIYTATIPGATYLPGYYSVLVTLALEFDIYEGSTSYTVLPADIVTEYTTTTRIRTKTDIETLYTESTKHITKTTRYTTTDTILKTGTIATKTTTLTGLVTETEYSPTITETITLKSTLIQQTLTFTPLLIGSIIVLRAMHLQRGCRRKEYRDS